MCTVLVQGVGRRENFVGGKENVPIQEKSDVRMSRGRVSNFFFRWKLGVQENHYRIEKKIK